MAIKESTIKRLFGLSRNECAMPECKSSLVVGDVVVGEICHIRARRKGGARYDPVLLLAEKDAFENLLLLCATCHKLVDSSPTEYGAVWLERIKAAHEQKTQMPLELSQDDVRKALLLLAKYVGKRERLERKMGGVSTFGNTGACATHGGVAVAIGGPNQGDIRISIAARKPSGNGYPPNSIGADANMTNYIEYLCDLYVKFMSPAEPNEAVNWARIGRHIKNKFRLRKRTRNHLAADRFCDLVHFLINDKLSNTPVGKKHLREGKKLCRTFDEFRSGNM
jgi:hypothetical protein